MLMMKKVEKIKMIKILLSRVVTCSVQQTRDRPMYGRCSSFLSISCKKNESLIIRSKSNNDTVETKWISDDNNL